MSHQDFIDKQKILYKSLQPTYCKVIQDTVHFTADGLNHILYHRRRPRKLTERAYRAALISYLVEVITDATKATKTIDPQFGIDPLWIIEHQVKAAYKGKKQMVKIILQKKGAGNTHFLSVMCREA